MEITEIQLLRDPVEPAIAASGVLDGILCTFRVSEVGLPDPFLETGPETVDLSLDATFTRGYLVIRNRIRFGGYLYLSGEFVPDA